MRCLQTAAAIAQEIKVTKVNINYILSEWLHPNFYPDGNPLHHLLLTKTPLKEYEQKYFGSTSLSIDKKFTNLDLMRFPEEYDVCIERGNTLLKNICSTY